MTVRKTYPPATARCPLCGATVTAAVAAAITTDLPGTVHSVEAGDE